MENMKLLYKHFLIEFDDFYNKDANIFKPTVKFLNSPQQLAPPSLPTEPPPSIYAYADGNGYLN